MSGFDIFKIAASGMSAQSVRLNTVASNLSNANNVGKTPETTYKAKQVVFEATPVNFDDVFSDFSTPASSGVQVTNVIEDSSNLNRLYKPGHPLADDQGYVYMTNVNVLDQMADMISASRAYQSNVEVMNTTKQLLNDTIKIGS